MNVLLVIFKLYYLKVYLADLNFNFLQLFYLKELNYFDICEIYVNF